MDSISWSTVIVANIVGWTAYFLAVRYDRKRGNR